MIKKRGISMENFTEKQWNERKEDLYFGLSTMTYIDGNGLDFELENSEGFKREYTNWKNLRKYLNARKQEKNSPIISILESKVCEKELVIQEFLWELEIGIFIKNKGKWVSLKYNDYCENVGEIVYEKFLQPVKWYYNMDEFEIVKIDNLFVLLFYQDNMNPYLAAYKEIYEREKSFIKKYNKKRAAP